MKKKKNLSVYINHGPWRKDSENSLEHKMFKEQGYEVSDTPGMADMIVFTGGADVSPMLYGQSKHSRTNTDADRDRHDLAVALMNPSVLKIGICRGGQFLNVLSGGSMFQHIADSHHLKGAHPIYICRKGEERVIFGATSTHHQMMLPAPRMGREILALAYREGDAHELGAMTLTEKAFDKEIPVQMLPQRHNFLAAYKKPDFDPRREDLEAVYYPDTGCLCVQGHPEYPTASPAFRDWFFDMVAEKYDEYENRITDAVVEAFHAS